MIKDKLFPVAQLISKITNQFYLAGGTAIMLKYDHRESYDLDFFYGKSFSFKRLENKIKKHVTGISHIAYGEDNLDIFIEGTKVSFVFFPFSNVKSIENYKGIRIASDLDLLLNKLYVGSRRIDDKDPFDVAWLWQKYDWQVSLIKQLFEKKFEGHSFELALGAMGNFEDYKHMDDWVKGVIQVKIQQAKSL
ncbi:MAG: nucleotidyl transferase AbiEii/AbiGii toxin family protein [Bacteroidales bacterium]|nr:nucleotidyl transferase AbiEii/AbiGii toxin family protein [Bacteroidales bacterium]MCF8336680.1 nucleotidyl transferase AbiEii/AbiGii toxin family protein [Bacteroidales bacterium]